MSCLVVDASIALSWLLPDEQSDLSLSVRAELLETDTNWVPAHWRLEVCNSLWVSERRKRLDSAGVAQAISLILQLPLLIDEQTNDRAGGETLALARQHAVSVYDAAYLELALRRGAALASFDEPLRVVAKDLGIPLLPRIPSKTK